MSTKDTSRKSYQTSGGQEGSPSMQLPTKDDATTPTQTLTDLERVQLQAEALAGMELNLNDLLAAGTNWQAFPYPTKTGKTGLVVAIYDSSCNLGVEKIEGNTVRLTVNGSPASEIATRK